MKRTLISIIAVSLAFSSIQSAQAVVNGTIITSNKYLVPIEANFNLTTSSYCSGVMISKNVLVTAGHCLLDENKQISKKIYVGKPGTQLNAIASDYGLVVQSFVPDDYAGNTVDDKVGASDIAFLVIDRIFSDVEELQIASENDLNLLKNSEGSLRALGYGFTSDNPTQNFNPYFFDGSFVNYVLPSRANTFIMSSKTAGACLGDSGGPIVNITPKKILLIGVITGSSIPTGNCTKPGSTGQYLLSFSGISRYANVLHLALVKGQEEMIKLGKSFEDEAKATKVLLESSDSEIASLKSTLQQKEAEALALKNELAIIRAMKKVITCVSGKKIKQVIDVIPVCPVGYKVKK
jgi:secreted trypsin-like serine protease